MQKENLVKIYRKPCHFSKMAKEKHKPSNEIDQNPIYFLKSLNPASVMWNKEIR